MRLSNRAYDISKFIAQIVLPAVGTMYFGLAQIWGLPKAEEVVGTIVIVDTFLGLLLSKSTRQYNKSDAKFDGEIVGHDTGEKIVYQLELNEDAENIANQKELRLKITPPV